MWLPVILRSPPGGTLFYQIVPALAYPTRSWVVDQFAVGQVFNLSQLASSRQVTNLSYNENCQTDPLPAVDRADGKKKAAGSPAALEGEFARRLLLR